MVNGTAPLSGLAVGALGCGLLVEYAPAPTRLVWALLLAGLVLAAVLVALIPETIDRRPGALASLRPRVGVPPRVRSGFAVIVPILLASWALAGLYLSLGGSVVAQVFGVRDHLVGGLTVVALVGTGAVTAFALRRRVPVTLLVPAAWLLAAGTVVTLAGVLTGVLALAAVGAVVAGLGFGSAAYATFGTMSTLAAPHERGELFAALYTLAYLAFSVPAMVAGVAATLGSCGPRRWCTAASSRCSPSSRRCWAVASPFPRRANRSPRRPAAADRRTARRVCVTPSVGERGQATTRRLLRVGGCHGL